MSRNLQHVIVFAIALAIAPFITSCGTEVPPVGPDVKYCADGSAAPGNDISRCPVPPPVESVSVSGNASVSFIGVTYPMAKVTISASGLSTAGKTVTVAVTVNGSPGAVGSITLSEGNHVICATATSSSGVKSAESCQTLVITWPSINGRFVAATPTGEYVPQGLWAVVEDVDSVRVNTDGTFVIHTLSALKDTAKVVVRGSSEVFPTLARVEKKYFASFVQISSVRNWVIPTGTYAGQVVGLSLEKAYTRTPPQGYGFFPRIPLVWENGAWRYVGEGKGTYGYFVGSYTSYPVRVAIYRGRSTITLSTVDEAKLWARLAEMEQTMGFDLFVQSDTASVNAFGGIRFMSNPGASGGVDYETRGDYISGMVNIGTGSDGTFSALEPTSGTAKHEFFHASGPIAHTCQFSPPSLMTQNCDVNQADDMTAEDVAYWHVMRLVRGLERKYDTRFSMAQMHQGERVFLLGLLEDKVIVFGPEGFSW